MFFAITFGVGFAALNTGNNLLYLVLSLMLSFLALSGVMSESALRGIEVRRRMPRELFAGSENPVRLELTNRQRRVPAFAVLVEDVVAKGALSEVEADTPRKRRRRRRRRKERTSAGRAFWLRVGPGESETRRYLLRPARRGTMALRGFRVSTRFPFGLFLKSREIAAPAEVLVYPAVEATRPRRPEGGPRETGRTQATALGQGGSVFGLREFAAGDPVRRVHWRASLRRGELLVGQIEDERDAEIEVLLRTSGDGARFERAVERAASEVVTHLEAGFQVGLRTDATAIPPDAGARQRARLLSFLALVEPGEPGGAEADAASEVAS